MMKIYLRLTRFLLLFTIGSTWAQQAPDLSQNRAVLRYLSAVDVQNIEQQNPEQYENLNYYFTESFLVSSVDPSASVDLLEFYNYDLFNIKSFENQRDLNSSIELNYRDKYVVVLKSVQEVQANMTMGIDEALQKPMRPLPQYLDTGVPTEDFESYKRELRIWILDFPEIYRTITSQNLVPKITISEYMMMSVQKKTDLSNLVDGYILIE